MLKIFMREGGQSDNSLICKQSWLANAIIHNLEGNMKVGKDFYTK
jgi:hypothetical protein